MNKEEILNLVRSLASSQGSYGRLYEELLHNEEFLDHLVNQNFKDSVDLILYLES